MSANDTRSIRQSKRMSVTALYLSMSAKEKDLEISDDLARGTQAPLYSTALRLADIVGQKLNGICEI